MIPTNGTVTALAAAVVQRLPELIRATRTIRRTTLTTAAKQLGTTTTVLTRWETGNMTSASYTQIITALRWVDGP